MESAEIQQCKVALWLFYRTSNHEVVAIYIYMPLVRFWARIFSLFGF